MRIQIDNIGKNGHQLQPNQSEAWLQSGVRQAFGSGLILEDGALITCSAKLDVRPPDKQGRVSVDLEVSASGMVRCDRCDEPCLVALSIDDSLRYLPASEAVDGPDAQEEHEVETADLDDGWYQGGGLELSDVICEALALSMPNRVVCADVPACDKRTEALFAAARPSEAPPGHPALQALKSLLRD